MNVMNIIREIAESMCNDFDPYFENNSQKIFKNKNIRNNSSSKFKYKFTYDKAFGSNNNGVYYTDADPFSYYVRFSGNEVFKDNWQRRRTAFNSYGRSDRQLPFNRKPYVTSSKERKKYYIARIQL